MAALEEITGRIFNVQHYSIRDGRGTRTVVFLKGCPARSLWCCNPESQRFQSDLYHVDKFCVGCGACERACKYDAVHVKSDGKAHVDRDKCVECFDCVKVCRTEAMQKMGYEITVAQALKEVMKDEPMYETTGGGMTLSGGEALAQPEFSLALMHAARENGIGCWIETCGVCRRDVLEEAADLCDGVFMDLKVMDPERSKKYVGYDSTRIKENAAAIAYHDKVTFRLPLVPDITDTPDNLAELADFLHQIGKDSLKIVKYHSLGVDKYPRLGRTYQYTGDGKKVDASVERAQAFFSSQGIETSIA